MSIRQLLASHSGNDVIEAIRIGNYVPELNGRTQYDLVVNIEENKYCREVKQQFHIHFWVHSLHGYSYWIAETCGSTIRRGKGKT